MYMYKGGLKLIGHFENYIPFPVYAVVTNKLLLVSDIKYMNI